MQGREKRIDLRLGGFACSLQGFDDPVATLGQILHKMQETQASLPEGGRPLFDEETLRRLESEIGEASNGIVSAVPGLVLAAERTGTADAAEADMPTPPEDAEPDPDAALAGLRSAIADEAEPEEDPDAVADELRTEAPAPTAADEATGAATVDNLFTEGDEPNAADADLNLFQEGETDENQDPVANELRAEAPAPTAADEPTGVATVDNLFTESDEPDAADSAEEEAHEDAAGIASDPSPAVEAGDEAAELEQSLAADDEEPATSLDAAASNLFEETDEPSAEDRILESRSETGGSGAAEDEQEVGDADVAEAPANLFADQAEEDDSGFNLFSTEEENGIAPVDATDDPAGAPEDEGIAPGSFRNLERFNPTAAPAPAAEAPPPVRRTSTISAAELAEKAGGKAPADLIAAAAAWLTVVKGHGSFTKREVLQIFEAMPGDHPKTAEAKVKGFGRLVRNGQVKQGEDERFRLSEAERDRYEELLD